MNPAAKVILIALGLAMLGFLGWSISDGVIYYKGHGTSRVDHPTKFWIEIAVLAVAAIIMIYTALTYKPKGQD